MKNDLNNTKVLHTESAEQHGYAETHPNNDLSLHILSEGLRLLNWSEQTEIHEVLNTPFCITRDKNGWNVTMGRYRMNAEPFKTWEEAFKDATTLDANKVLSMIICVNDFNNKQK